MRSLFAVLVQLVLLAQVICQETFSSMYEERIKMLALVIQNKLGEPVRNILDVGAHSGDWTRTMNKLFQDSKFLMIEANPKKTKALSTYSTQSGHGFEIAVVGDKAKTVTFHAHKHFNTGGSLYREQNYKYWKPHVIETFTAEMQTIDSIVKRRGFGPVDMLKIDIQGAEFIALLGAVETLASVQYVMLEAAVHQYNPGAPGFADINTFLEMQGFRLYDIIDFRQDKLVWDKMPNNEQWGPENKFPMGKILMQFDCLWARNTSLVFKNQGYPDPPKSRFAYTLLPE
jgi:FkbM family methyltransferase